MTRRVLISGSVAFDTITVADSRFRDHILPDRIHRLNVSFLTPELKRENGGCAANIAYNLRALGGEPVILGAVGRDGAAYRERLQSQGIDCQQLLVLDDSYTAQGFVITDLDANQIWAWHSGAMSLSHQARVDRAGAAAWAIAAPSGKDAMQQHARGVRQASIPFLFDPGQGLGMFDGAELRELVAIASAVIVNDYEASVLAEKLGESETALCERLPVMIITRGAEGSDIWEAGRSTHVDAAPIGDALDPTGCGDAYRAGLLHGLAQGWPWVRSARLGSVLGAIKIESKGPQNHAIDRSMVADRLRKAYGESL